MNCQNLELRNNCNRVSTTAKLMGYARVQSNIPYSKEIAECVKAEETAKEFFGEMLEMLTTLASIHLEARYKSINDGLRREGLSNVLELAMGLSPRGLEYATNGHEGIYVGTDLPDIVSETAEMIKEVAKKHRISTQNVYFQPVNVLERKQLEEAVQHFEGEKFGVCNEGLLMYLNREEQAQMARNVREILLTSGGSWVTPDIDNLQAIEKRIVSHKPEIRKIAETEFMGSCNKTGKNLRDAYFSTEKEALKFYEDLGFSVEILPFDQGYNLSTYHRLTEDMKNQVMKSLSTRNVWILKTKK